MRWPRPTRATLFSLTAAGLAFGVAMELHAADEFPLARSIGDFLGGAGFLVAGAIAWSRRPGNPAGPIMLLYGLTWFAGNLRFTDTDPVAFTLGYLIASPGGVLLFVLLLLFPDDRVAPGVPRALAGAAVILGTVLYWPTLLIFEPRSHGCEDCRPGLNLLLARDAPDVYDVVSGVWSAAIVAVFLATTVVLAGRLRRSSATRRVLVPVYVPGVLFFAVTIAGVALYGFDDETTGARGLGLARATLACAMPFGFLFGVLQARRRSGPVGDLLLDLSGAVPAGDLRQRLARALGDPTLDIGFWAPAAGGYVDSAGRPLELPGGAERAATHIDGERGPLAVLLHDTALLEDRALLSSVAAAARLALENERLQAEVRAQLEAVRASRRRLVTAADDERRRIERDLHDGAQQRLVGLSMGLRLLADDIDGRLDGRSSELLQALQDEAQAAIGELRELAHGIHPKVLTDHGLPAALQSVAERAPLPVRLALESDERLPPPVEAAAYFVCAEALSNAAKHAGARSVEISGRSNGTAVQLSVADDGRGGADPARGTGLRGLQDRVAALGGALAVVSPPGGGTRIEVRIPYAPDGA